MNPLLDPDDPDEATRTINDYAISDWTKFTYSTHAKEQMGARRVPIDIVQLTLRQGRVTEIRQEIKGQNLCYSYRVDMIDKYGTATVVTAIVGPHHLLIVTVFTDVPDDK
jgi:hypothetical protein